MTSKKIIYFGLNMRSSYFKLFCLICCIVLSCTDEPPITVVHTGLVKNITEEGALFTGSIQGSGTDEILEYGFVWSTTNEPSLLNSHFKVGKGSFKGEFEQLIRSDLSNNSEYNVWAYVINPATTIFGEAVSFRSKGVAGPIIISFNPISGSSNDVITITGNNFSQQPESNIVKVGSLMCTIISSTTSEIKAKLPNGITSSGKYKVSVKIGEATAFSTDDFTLEGPMLTAVNPLSAIQGTTIIIDGEGFSAVPAENIVKFGQTVSPVIAASATQLVVKVPPTNFAGTVPLTVTVKGITGQFTLPFTIEGPEIFSVNPMQDYPGKTLTITGKNFSDVISENIILFASRTVKILEATSTELKVEIPSYLSINPGIPVDVSVEVTQKSFTKPNAFTPLSPWTTVAEFVGTARTHAASFVIGDKGYLGTGTFSANCSCYMNDFWSYDPQNDSWVQKADFPGAERYYAMGFSVGGKGYIIGGYTPAGASKELWEYDAILDQWTQKNSFIFPVSSQHGKVVTINDKAYLQEGYVFYEYDAAQDQWNPRASFVGTINFPPSRLISFAMGGKVYKSGDAKEFYEYDPQLDIWTRKADIPLPDGGYHFTSFSVNEKGYVGSGRYHIDFLYSYSFYRYDPVYDKWEQIPSTHYTVQNAATFVINGTVYYGIGNAGDFVQKNFVKFNPNY